MTKQEFLDGCKSARMVKTYSAWAILIGDEVIEIQSNGVSDRTQLLCMAIRGETLAEPEYKMTLRDPGKEWVA